MLNGGGVKNGRVAIVGARQEGMTEKLLEKIHKSRYLYFRENNEGVMYGKQNTRSFICCVEANKGRVTRQ